MNAIAKMNAIKIVVGQDPYISSVYSHIIDTTFYISVNHIAFPDLLWTDFSYPVLSDWAKIIAKNYYNRMPVFELFFLDGPYHITCKTSHQDITLEMVDDHQDKIIATATCSYHEWMHVLLAAIEDLQQVIAFQKVARAVRRNLEISAKILTLILSLEKEKNFPCSHNKMSYDRKLGGYYCQNHKI